MALKSGLADLARGTSALKDWSKERFEDISGANTQEALAPFREMAKEDRQASIGMRDQFGAEYDAIANGLAPPPPPAPSMRYVQGGPPVRGRTMTEDGFTYTAPVNAADYNAAAGDLDAQRQAEYSRQMEIRAASGYGGSMQSAPVGAALPASAGFSGAPAGGGGVASGRPVDFAYAGGARPRGYGFDQGWQAQMVGDIGIQSPEQARAEQLRALGLMRGAAEGTAPSVAQMQQALAFDQINRDTASVAAQARGQDAAAARRQQMLGMGQAGGQAALQSALLRAQEMAQARGQFGEAANQLRAGDQQLSTDQANLLRQTRTDNANRDVAAAGMYNQVRAGLRSDRMGAQGLANQATGAGLGVALSGAQAAQQGSAAIGQGLATTAASLLKNDDE